MTQRLDPGSESAGDGIFGLPHTPEEAGVVLVPVPFEATVSYRAGTVGGPRAILAASTQVDLLDRETGHPFEAGIAMLDIPPQVSEWNDAARQAALPVIEAGGPGEDPALGEATSRVDEYGERVNAWVSERTSEWLDRGRLVGIIGGDHSTPFGAIQVLAERHPGLGILHIDAHADLRRAYEGFRWSHASIMYNVLEQLPDVAGIVQVGIRDYSDEENELIRDNPSRIRSYFEADLREQLYGGETWGHLAGGIVAELPRTVYVSFDIDGLDPTLCPSTGTPVPGGLSFNEATFLLKALVKSGRRVVGFDLSEVAPATDGSEWDGNVGARMLYKLIGFSLMSQQASF